MHVSEFRVPLVAFCGFLLGAQAQTAPSAGGIAGVVVDSRNNSPIRRAIITLSTVEAQPQDAVAWTDANGRFSFGYLPPGRYQLRAAKDGYQGAVFGGDGFRRPAGTIQLAAGQFRSDLIFRLQLMNSVAGIVLDEDGEPLAGVQVMAMSSGFQRQKRKLLPGPMAMTDSAGRFRLRGFAPGRYAVAAYCPNRPAIKIHPEAAAGEPQQQYSYGVQYYPGTDRAEAAGLLTVQPGAGGFVNRLSTAGAANRFHRRQDCLAGRGSLREGSDREHYESGSWQPDDHERQRIPAGL